MKKVVETIKELAQRYDFLYDHVYSHHFKDDESYMRLSQALAMIGYELAPEDKQYEGDYGDIKGYYGCYVCKKNDDDMDDEELTKYFSEKFKYARSFDISDIWELTCDQSLSLVGRRNGKEVEDIEYNTETKLVQYRYEYSNKPICVPLEKVYKNLRVIN